MFRSMAYFCNIKQQVNENQIKYSKPAQFPQFFAYPRATCGGEQNAADGKSAGSLRGRTTYFWRKQSAGACPEATPIAKRRGVAFYRPFATQQSEVDSAVYFPHSFRRQFFFVGRN